MGCAECGRDFDPFPWKCKFCGGSFCKAHRLPESHNCYGLKEFKQTVKQARSEGQAGIMSVDADYISSHHKGPYVESQRYNPPKKRFSKNSKRGKFKPATEMFEGIEQKTEEAVSETVLAEPITHPPQWKGQLEDALFFLRQGFRKVIDFIFLLIALIYIIVEFAFKQPLMFLAIIFGIWIVGSYSFTAISPNENSELLFQNQLTNFTESAKSFSDEVTPEIEKKANDFVENLPSDDFQIEEFTEEIFTPEREVECKLAFDYINEIRVENNRSPMEWDVRAYKLAVARSKDMWERDYFDHVTPEGTCAKDFKTEYGFSNREILAENAGGMSYYSKGSVAGDCFEAADGWLDSRGHRYNLLYSGHKSGAIGCYNEICVFFGVHSDPYGLGAGPCSTGDEGLEYWNSLPLQSDEV
ncbi:MAG: CAP domain-containing protein [archaeon]|nr:CAP domain-containing protein [archaeon]